MILFCILKAMNWLDRCLATRTWKACTVHKNKANMKKDNRVIISFRMFFQSLFVLDFGMSFYILIISNNM